MKHLLFWVSIWMTVNCNAQQNSFFNYYADSVKGSNNCISILELEDSSIVVYNIYQKQGSTLNYTLIFTNTFGDVLYSKNAHAWLTAPLRRTKLNKGFAGVGGYLCPGSGLALLVYDKNGDTLWTRCYPQSIYNWGPMGTGFDVCRDSGFIVSGYQQIVKLDKYGDVQWVSPLPFATTDAHETIEGDFIVCGSGNEPYKAALFDSAGNLKWNKGYGTLYSPWATYTTTSIMQSSADSNFYLACQYNSVGTTGIGYNMIKVDKATGDTMSTYIFAPYSNIPNDFIFVMELSDSTILCAVNFYYQHYDKFGNHLGAYLNIPAFFGCGAIYDYQPSNDRSVIGSGYQCQGVNPNFYDQGCYFKTDSNFQITNFTGMAEHARDKPLYVFPNPASDYFNVGLPYMPAPIFLTITVYDVYGKLCFTKTANSESELRINCNGWPSGLYVVRGVDRKGVVSLGKLLIKD